MKQTHGSIQARCGEGVGRNFQGRLRLVDSEEALFQLDLPNRVCVEGDGVEQAPISSWPDFTGAVVAARHDDMALNSQALDAFPKARI